MKQLTKGTVNLSSKEYPALLKKIGHPPEKIYYKGEWKPSLFQKCLSVVGSRRMTRYGKQATESLIASIARAGITIVSGFMYGIDATAHRTALDAGGKTIAVMPCGIERIHPEYQEDLYNEILDKKGLIISEFEGLYPPQLWMYPRRNRIMAGLSCATVVIEAAEKSGSLITAELSRKYNRKIFAVPGPINSITSTGTINLIKKGATIVSGVEDILTYYGIENTKLSNNTKSFSHLTSMEQAIVKELHREGLQIDELSRLIKVSASKLGTTLSLMQLKGLLIKEEGKYYINKS